MLCYWYRHFSFQPVYNSISMLHMRNSSEHQSWVDGWRGKARQRPDENGVYWLKRNIVYHRLADQVTRRLSGCHLDVGDKSNWIDFLPCYTEYLGCSTIEIDLTGKPDWWIDHRSMWRCDWKQNQTKWTSRWPHHKILHFLLLLLLSSHVCSICPFSLILRSTVGVHRRARLFLRHKVGRCR